MIPTPGRGALLVAALLILAGESFAQAWRSTLYPESWVPPTVTSGDFENGKLIQDFSYAGYQRGEVPLPTVSGPVFDVTQSPWNADPSGATDSTAAIQGAIDAAQDAGGGVVLLPEGLYLVEPPGSETAALQITEPGVVLRGAGADKTFILNNTTSMRAKAIIRVNGPGSASWRADTGASSAIASDLPGPTTEIPVASVAIFSPGDWVVIRADATDEWIAEHNEPAWTGYNSSLGGFAYFRKVLAVDASTNVLTIDIPTRYYLKTRDNARVHRSVDLVSEIGLEHFSIGNVQNSSTTGWGESDYATPGTSAYDTHNCSAILIERVRDSWVSGVETFQAAGNTSTCHILSTGLRIQQSRSVTVRDCHFQRPQYGGGGGNGYMYRIHDASDNLIDQCRATFSRHGFNLLNMASSGNVFHRCVDTDTGKMTGSSGSVDTGGRSSDHHRHFSHSNLVDACTADNSWFEARYRTSGSVPQHLLTAAHCVFWNTEGIGSGQTYVVRSEQSRYGYVIGTRGTRTGVVLTVSATGQTDPADHVEGTAIGSTLEPFSLFEDQVLRRLSIPVVTLPAEATLAAPTNSLWLDPTVTIGGEPADSDSYSVQWTQVTGPDSAVFEETAARATWASFPVPGLYTLEISVTLGEFTVSEEIAVDVRPFEMVEEFTLISEADAYVRGGESGDINFGTASVIALKEQGSEDFWRRGFMRFDLTSIGAGTVLESLLTMTRSTAADSTTVETYFVPTDSWTENGITWNNQPATSGAALAQWGLDASGEDTIDLTAKVAEEFSGDGLLSLQHRILAQPETSVYNWVSRDGASASRPRLLVRVRRPVAGFEEWIAGYPDVPPSGNGPGDDPDEDGRTSLVEFVNGTDPGAADRGGTELSPDGRSITFAQAKTLPADVYYRIEHSPTLAGESWEIVPGVTYSQEEASETVWRMTALLPVSSEEARGFYRLFIVGLDSP